MCLILFVSKGKIEGMEVENMAEEKKKKISVEEQIKADKKKAAKKRLELEKANLEASKQIIKDKE